MSEKHKAVNWLGLQRIKCTNAAKTELWKQSSVTGGSHFEQNALTSLLITTRDT